MLLFDVYGRRLGIRREGEEWVTIEVGFEGKSRPARVAIPPWVTEDGLAQFLADLFHESATPDRPDVLFLGRTDRRAPG